MFQIDTSSSSAGLKGPFLSWTSEGSARKGLAPESWSLRNKDETSGVTTQAAVAGFTQPAVIDLDSVKIGWEKDGGKGSTPQREWSPTTARRIPRPSEEKKATGGFAWSEAFACRVATKDANGNPYAATWSQSAFGANEAFISVMKQAAAQWATHSQNGTLLPLVRQVSVERRKMTNGDTAIPVLVIEKWVPRPAVLMVEAAPFAIAAPAVATPAPAPAYTPPPPAPAPAAAASADF